MSAAEVSGSALAAVLAGITYESRIVPVYGQVPDRFTPPAVVVEPSDPWIVNETTDLPYGVMEFRYLARVVAGQGTTRKEFDVLHAVAVDVLARLHGSPVWTAGQAGSPYALELREGASYLSADITVSAIAHITE